MLPSSGCGRAGNPDWTVTCTDFTHCFVLHLVRLHVMKLRQLLWVGIAVLVQALLAEGKGKDYYGVLGLKKNAKEDAIKKAYRWI